VCKIVLHHFIFALEGIYEQREALNLEYSGLLFYFPNETETGRIRKGSGSQIIQTIFIPAINLLSVSFFWFPFQFFNFLNWFSLKIMCCNWSKYQSKINKYHTSLV